jgi:flagellar biosynthesis protein FlhG
MKESYIEYTKIKEDQALSLRMKNKIEKTRPLGLTRVISFTSGKGGVGKTNTVVNVAISLASMGKSVLILDADLGLANVDVMLGLRVGKTLNDVVEGTSSLSDVLVSGPGGISIIPSASGVESICNLDATQRLALMHAVEEIAADYDYLLIDTSAGISADVMQFNSAANEIVCVITNEPTSLTDAYALIKVLAKNYAEKSVSILVNNIASKERSIEHEANRTFKRLESSVQRFLHKEQVELRYLGHIPADPLVGESVRNQRAVTELFPSGPAGLSFAALARRIDDEFRQYRIKGGMQFFFRQILEAAVHGS